MSPQCRCFQTCPPLMHSLHCRQYLIQFLFRFTNMFTSFFAQCCFFNFMPSSGLNLFLLLSLFFFFFLVTVVLTIFVFILVVLNIFTLLLFSGFPELFHLAKLKLCTHFYLPSAPGNHHSIFCFYEFDYFKPLISVESQNTFDWLILLSVISSRFIHVVTSIRTSFLFKVG